MTGIVRPDIRSMQTPLLEGMTMTATTSHTPRTPKAVIHVGDKPARHWVGDGFPVHGMFDYGQGAEHGHHVLKAHGHHLGPGQALIGGNHPLGLQRPVNGAHRSVGGGSLGIG